MKTIAVILLHLMAYTSLGLMLGIAPFWAAGPGDWIVWAVAAVLIWISLWDFAHMEIPDIASLMLAGLAMVWIWQAGLPVTTHLAGGLLWPLVFFAVARGYQRVRGQEGLGFGDVKLMVPVGLLCGVMGTVHVVLFAALAGIATMILAVLSGKTAGLDRFEDDHPLLVPFGPFLCFGCWFVWLSQ